MVARHMNPTDFVVHAIRKWAPHPNGAKRFHQSITNTLRGYGWMVQREVFVSDRGDGYRGRIDIVAKRGDSTVAIELDNKSPRAKSITKLGAYEADARLIVLRRPCDPYVSGGVTVFGVEVST